MLLLAMALALAAWARPAWASGAVVVLFPQPNLKGKDPAWVVPDPASPCAAFPAGFSPASGQVWWGSKDGKAPCPLLNFHATPNCQGPALSIPQPPPPKKGAQWITTLNDLTSGQYADVAKAQSISCSTGAASAPQSAASSVVGVATGSDLWLAALNAVRSQGNSAANPLAWDASLAASAQQWTKQLNATQCGAPQIVLSKIPASGHSESDVWISYSTKESDAVAAWAPDPSDTSNPRTARIIDSDASTVGCASTICSPGAFFTCLFAPILY